jgi:polar amino acid transport system substrate-binding protein
MIGGSLTAAPLRVGIATNYPPLAFRREGEVVGIEADLARKAARELQRRLDLVGLSWEDLIPALVEGRIDVIMSGMSITPGRQEQVRFVEPYLRVGQMALLKKAELIRLGGALGLRRAGVRVGFSRSTTGEAFVRGQLAEAEPRGFASVDDGVAALRAGEIEYFVHDAPAIWRVTMEPAQRDLVGLYELLTEEYLAWAVRLADAELASALGSLVGRWKADGELNPILRRWIPVRVKIN